MRLARLVSFFFALVGCRGATQIEVTVTTDVPCARVTETSFTSGQLGQIESIPPTSTSATCVGGRVGAIVLVPSGDESAQIGFKIVAALDGQAVEACGAGGSYGPKCIVARRGIRFIPHASLSVPVAMRLACAGIGCGDPLLTCVQGQCVPATIKDPSLCQGSGCAEGALLGADGGAPVGDAGAVDATSADAGSDGSPVGPAPEAGPGPLVPQCDLGGLQSGAAWPMEGYCPTHRNRTPFIATTTASPPLRGPFPVDGPIDSAPSIAADGTLFLGTEASTIQAFHPDGSPYWRYTDDAGALFKSMPAIAADQTVRELDYNSTTQIYVVLDPKTGAPLRRVPGSAQVRGGITVVSGGTIYVPDNSNATLAALSPQGSVLWSGPGSDDTINPAVSPDHTIFVSDSNGNLSAVYPDGGLRWKTPSAGNTQALLGLAVGLDGSIRGFSYPANSVYSFDIQTNAQRWKVSYTTGSGAGEVNGFSLADDGTMYVGTQSTGIATVDGSGNKGSKTFGTTCNAPAIDGAGHLIAWCDGKIVSVSADLSTLSWQVPLPTASLGQPLVLDTPVVGPNGAVYFALQTTGLQDGGTLYGLYSIGP